MRRNSRKAASVAALSRVAGRQWRSAAISKRCRHSAAAPRPAASPEIPAPATPSIARSIAVSVAKARPATPLPRPDAAAKLAALARARSPIGGLGRHPHFARGGGDQPAFAERTEEVALPRRRPQLSRRGAVGTGGRTGSDRDRRAASSASLDQTKSKALGRGIANLRSMIDLSISRGGYVYSRTSYLNYGIETSDACFLRTDLMRTSSFSLGRLTRCPVMD